MADTRKVLGDALEAWERGDGEDTGLSQVRFVLSYLASHNVALVEDNDQHYAQVVSHGDNHWDWTIQHPARCRPDLIACPLNEQMNRYFHLAALDGMMIDTGRYTLDSDGAQVTLR